MLEQSVGLIITTHRQETWYIKCFGCRNIFFLILIDIWYYSFLTKYIYYPDHYKYNLKKRKTLYHVFCGTATFGLLYLKLDPPLFTLFLYLLSLYSSLFQFFQYPRFLLTSKSSILSLSFIFKKNPFTWEKLHLFFLYLIVIHDVSVSPVKKHVPTFFLALWNWLTRAL